MTTTTDQFGTEIHAGTGEPSNSQRAEWTREALDAFAVEVFSDRTFTGMIEEDGLRGDGPSVIQDLITDVLHMAMKIGFTQDEAREIGEKAIRMFDEEVDQEQNAEEAGQ